MEIEVGEYVRTKDGIIDIVILPYKGKCANQNCNDKHISCKANYYIEDEIIKHSKNIIDLIEVGDYINGHKVVSELWGEDDNNLYFEIEGGFNKAQYIGEKDIKTVLTHEQFEQNAYRLEEK